MTRLPSLHIPCLLVTPVPCFFSSPRLLLLPYFPFLPANKPFSPRAFFHQSSPLLTPSLPIYPCEQTILTARAFFHQSSLLLTPSLLYSPPSTGFLLHVRLLSPVITSPYSLTSLFPSEYRFSFPRAPSSIGHRFSSLPHFPFLPRTNHSLRVRLLPHVLAPHFTLT